MVGMLQREEVDIQLGALTILAAREQVDDGLDDLDGAQWPKRVKTEKKFTGSKIGAIFCKITS